MKNGVFTWMFLLTSVGLCLGQQSEEHKKYYEDFARSEQRAVAEYPDAARHDSPLAKRMAEIDKALNAASDPLYHSADKPYIIAQMAAKDLGIEAPKTDHAATVPSSPEPSPQSAVSGKRSAEWLATKDRAWILVGERYPIFFRDSEITRRLYAKVVEWDALAKVNNPTLYNNPSKPLFYAAWFSEILAQERAAQEAAEAAAAASRPRVVASSGIIVPTRNEFMNGTDRPDRSAEELEELKKDVERLKRDERRRAQGWEIPPR